MSKRGRDSDPDSDSEPDSENPAADVELLSGSESNSENSHTFDVDDLGDGTPPEAILGILSTVLQHVTLAEDVETCVKRLSAADKLKRQQLKSSGATATVTLPSDVVIDASQQLVALFNLDVSRMKREEIVLIFLKKRLECARLRKKASDAASAPQAALEPIPKMWVLRWASDSQQTLHGPFLAHTMRQWQEQKYFEKKKAFVSDANDLTNPRSWVEAGGVQFT